MELQIGDCYIIELNLYLMFYYLELLTYINLCCNLRLIMFLDTSNLEDQNYYNL